MDGWQLLLADAILLLHFAIALFLTLGLPAVWLGHFLRWRLIHSRLFRYTHAGIMLFVLVEALLGKLCPLTVWESQLRLNSDDATSGYDQGFIFHWVDRLLFPDIPAWIFPVLYAAYFAAVMATFVLIPVQPNAQTGKK
ncbi:conserved membrane protein of unknown function [Pseudodesulfovibrio profundus]|uniref:Transmembrane protein n=1 Tax=Pseudodesulfovibrio profundus TaxID=57320 RepID=A0A2C8F922_9BACT|nr:DUF2784 domain-containing protein [Pseudodesulfovibrio profundus]SOB59264.1 conserved membrane protein of unknown function [Pseudodesulfovibrio profundus]